MATYVDQDAILASDVLHGAMWHGNSKQTTMTRVFVVQVLVAGQDPKTAAYRATQVGRGTSGGIPQYGDLHPNYPALQCTDISSEAMGDKSPNQFRVTCSYTNTSDASKSTPSTTGICAIEHSTVTTNLKTAVDNAGNPMYLQFTDPNNGNKVRLQPAEADIVVCMPVVTFRRREPLGTDYVVIKTSYEGRINTDVFLGKPAYTWMCTSIHASLQSDAYDVSYTFQYHGHVYPNSWNPIFFFREKDQVDDVAAGAPAKGISKANGGMAQFTVYPTATFGDLNLRLV